MKVDGFEPGDIVSFKGSTPTSTFVIERIEINFGGTYIYLENVSGGYYPNRFNLICSVQPQPLSSTEYEDIMAGQEIYSELEGSNG